VEKRTGATSGGALPPTPGSEQLPLTTGARPKSTRMDSRLGELLGRRGDHRGLTMADVRTSERAAHRRTTGYFTGRDVPTSSEEEATTLRGRPGGDRQSTEEEYHRLGRERRFVTTRRRLTQGTEQQAGLSPSQSGDDRQSTKTYSHPINIAVADTPRNRLLIAKLSERRQSVGGTASPTTVGAKYGSVNRRMKATVASSPTTTATAG
jgi:hypothetical protein